MGKNKKAKIVLPAVTKTNAELAADVYAAACHAAGAWSPWQRYVLGATEDMVADAYDLALAEKKQQAEPVELEIDEPKRKPIEIEISRAPVVFEADNPHFWDRVLTLPDDTAHSGILEADADRVLTLPDDPSDVEEYESISLREYFELDKAVQEDIRRAWVFSSTSKKINDLVANGTLKEDSKFADRLFELAYERYPY